MEAKINVSNEGPYLPPPGWFTPPEDQPPYDPSEMVWARDRPPWQQPPRPTVGDHVHYRHDPWGEITCAQVVRILDDPEDDPNVYRYVLNEQSATRSPIVDGAGRRLVTLAPDPDPSVELHTQYGRVVTREARLRGSPGWLPLDYERYWRPNGPVLRIPGPVQSGYRGVMR
jgi:hypothetical protein